MLWHAARTANALLWHGGPGVHRNHQQHQAHCFCTQIVLSAGCTSWAAHSCCRSLSHVASPHFFVIWHWQRQRSPASKKRRFPASLQGAQRERYAADSLRCRPLSCVRAAAGFFLPLNPPLRAAPGALRQVPMNRFPAASAGPPRPPSLRLLPAAASSAAVALMRILAVVAAALAAALSSAGKTVRVLTRGGARRRLRPSPCPSPPAPPPPPPAVARRRLCARVQAPRAPPRLQGGPRGQVQHGAAPRAARQGRGQQPEPVEHARPRPADDAPRPPPRARALP